MKKDINLTLIYVIVILLLINAGSVLYYHTKYNDLKTSCEETIEKYNKSMSNLTKTQKQLYESLNESNLSNNRESELIEKLDKKNIELENTINELTDIKQKYFDCQREYNLQIYNNTFDKNKLNDKIDEMQDKLDKLKLDILNNESETVILSDIDEIQKILDEI